VLSLRIPLKQSTICPFANTYNRNIIVSFISLLVRSATKTSPVLMLEHHFTKKSTESNNIYQNRQEHQKKLSCTT